MEIYNGYNQPKHYVAVDCVIFGYDEDELKLLLYPRRFEPSFHDWSIMGGFVQEGESLDNAARRVLKLTVGLENIYMEQVGGFSEPNRDPGGRVISMAYYSLIRVGEYDKELVSQTGGKWFSISKFPTLVFDHAEIVENALKKLQQKATYELIGKDLLPNTFTLTQLNNLYNAIFQRSFDAGNFRKKIASLKLLDRLTTKQTDTSKRGAFYFQFKENIDHTNYDRIVKF
jgi:ADP-ribose pyrophosphatase YjhB (NUDIX family)